MTSGEFDFGPEQFSTETLSLAAAITRRNVMEGERSKSDAGGLQETPTPVEIQERMQTGATVLMLTSLDNSTSSITPERASVIMFDDTMIKLMLESQGEDVSAEDIASMRTLITAQIGAMWQHFGVDRNKASGFSGSIEAARNIAELRKVSVSDVFLRDDLYEALIRSQYTPDQYAQQLIDGAGKINEEVILSMLDAMIVAHLREEGLSPEEIEAEKEELKIEFLEEDSMINEVRGAVGAIQETLIRRVPSQITRFWGESATAQLGHHIKFTLDKEPANTDVIKEALERQKQCRDIISLICIERGWDIANLSVRQMAEINKSEMMQKFNDRE